MVISKEYTRFNRYGYNKSKELNDVIEHLELYHNCNNKSAKKSILNKLSESTIKWGKIHPREFKACYGQKLLNDIEEKIGHNFSLECKNLKSGDIMLKIEEEKIDPATIFIKLLQITHGGKGRAICSHAGIMFDNNYIIEAQSKGINANDLRVKNKGVGYLVFRCKNEKIAKGAGICAKIFYDISHNRFTEEKKIFEKKIKKTTHTIFYTKHNVKPLKYDYKGAFLKSGISSGTGSPRSNQEMNTLMEDLLINQKHSHFFCSQLVVYIYQFVAAQNGVNKTIFSGSDGKFTPSRLWEKLERSKEFSFVGYMKKGERPTKQYNII